jgi:hypothetical protein
MLCPYKSYESSRFVSSYNEILRLLYIASDVASDASQLASRYANTTHKHWSLTSDQKSESALKTLVCRHDLVIR